MSDELWERIQSLPPKWERRLRYPGRRSVPDRQVLCGILFVLHTGIQGNTCPRNSASGPVVTCRRRLRDWNEAGVWQQLGPNSHSERADGFAVAASSPSGAARANRRGREAGDGQVTPVPAARGQGVDEPGVDVVTDATRLDLDHFVPVTDVYDPEQAPWSAARGEGCFTGSQWWVETAGRRQCAAAKWRRGSRNALCRGELRRVAAAR
ncbi:transposase [Streptomyces goshikiensis]|uniref:transposase n=1 Tax=Streptomyces goshikiensis TaxID=1942 RepID=UPI0036585249